MSAPAPSSAALPRDPDRRWDRAWLAAAFAVTFAWFFYYQRQPGQLVDEGGHLGNVYHFLEGKPGWPEAMTMLPGYHFLVATLWKLHPPISLLTLARLVSAVLSCIGLLAFASAWRSVRAQRGDADAPGPGRATLLLALLPILHPFTGMAYTDAPALAFVLAACAAQFAGRYGLAALWFVLAASVRQTNLTWVGFAVAWEWIQFRRQARAPHTDSGTQSGPPAAAALRAFFRHTCWLWVLLVVGAVCVGLAGRVSVGTQTGTELRGNIATLHTGALLVLLLGLPLWLRAGPAALHRLGTAVRRRPLVALAALALAAGTVVLLTKTFANPHVWNRDLFWAGCSFTLLRNWPLVWIDSHAWLRLVSALNVVLMAAALAVAFSSQRRRAEAWLAFAIGALLPAANNLVEPRYFIPAAALVLLFLDFDRPAWRGLAAWWALLCAVHAPFIQRGLSLW